MNIERRVEQLERQNRRFRLAQIMLTVVLCCVVTIGATGKDAEFEMVRAKTIVVENEAGEIIVAIGANENGDGVIETASAQGKELVALATTGGGEGAIATYAASGKLLVTLTTTDSGGSVTVYNKTGERVVMMEADDYGNGKVGVWNRKGKGRVYDSK